MDQQIDASQAVYHLLKSTYGYDLYDVHINEIMDIPQEVCEYLKRNSPKHNQEQDVITNYVSHLHSHMFFFDNGGG